MPSASPSLQRARNLALQPQGWGVPPGTEDWLDSTDSLLLPHGTNAYPYANTQQIYRKVCEWFVSWRPWQQKMLLCGITNKCSVVQLESLATTLEPIFHRDFVATLRKGYPQLPFQKKPKSGDKTQGEDRASVVNGSDVLQLEKGATKDSTMLAGIAEVASPVKDVATPQVPPPLAEFAKEFAKKLMEDSLQHYREFVEAGGDAKPCDPEISQALDSDAVPSEDPVLTSEPSVAATVTATVTETTEQGDRADTSPSLSQLPTDRQYALPVKMKSEIIVSTRTSSSSERKLQRASSMDGAHYLRQSSIDSHQSSGLRKGFKYKASRVINTVAILQAFRKVNSRQQQRSTGPGMPLVNHHLTLSRRLELLQAQPPSPSESRLHRHRSRVSTSLISHAEFFEKNQADVLGPMQAEMRTGPVCRLPAVPTSHVPMQRLYKPSKWWSPSPRDGKAFVKPKKRDLNNHFKLQLQQIWEWMSIWQEFEKLSLLVEVLKLCDASQISYFTQCLSSRLQDDLDINWLSDRLLLLVFSYLSPDGIEACSRVCRRWRYLTSIDDLWRLKCHELGLSQGIPKLLNLISKWSPAEQGIDWKLAYLELQRIAYEAKDSIPIPKTLSFQGPTPEGMRRVGGGKFVPLFTEATLKPMGRGLSLRGGPNLPPIPSVTSSMSHSRSMTVEYVPYWENEERERLMAEGSEKTSSHADEPKSEAAELSPRSSKDAHKDATDPQDLDASDAKDDMLLASLMKGSSHSLVGSQIVRRQKKNDDEGEVALDVRPELLQAIDLLRDISQQQGVAEAAKQQLAKFAGGVSSIQRVRRLQGHMDSVLCVEHDWRRLISGSMDRTIRMYDIRSGRSIQKFYGHKGGVCSLQFDNETLYSGSWDMSIMAWDLVSFQRCAVLTGHRGSISAIRMNKEVMMSSSHDATVRVWCRKSHLVLKILRIHRRAILSMCLDGRHILTGSSDNTMKLTDLSSGDCVKTFHGHTEAVDKMAIAGNLIITANKRGIVYFWSRQHGTLEAAIQAHDSSVNGLALFKSHFFTASNDATIKEWDLGTMATVRILQGHKGPVNDIKVSKRCFVSCSTDGHIRIWDLQVPAQRMGDEENDNIRLEVVDQRKKTRENV